MLQAGGGGRLYYFLHGSVGEVGVSQLGQQMVVMLLQSMYAAFLGLQSALELINCGSQVGGFAISRLEGGSLRRGDGGEMGGVLALEHLGEDL